MTKKEWLIQKMQSDDEFAASVIIENVPTCSDRWGWEDQYRNPFNPKFKITAGYSVLGFKEYEEEVFYDDYDDVKKDVIQWLKEEHKNEKA